MRVQTKGVDKNYSFPHIKYTQLMFTVILPFSILDTHACTLLFSNAFFSATLFHTRHTCRYTRVLTKLSGLCRHTDSSGQSVPLDILSVIRNASLIFYNSITYVLPLAILLSQRAAQACDLTCWFRGTKRAVMSGTDWIFQAALLANAFFVSRMRAGAKLLIKYA